MPEPVIVYQADTGYADHGDGELFSTRELAEAYAAKQNAAANDDQVWTVTERTVHTSLIR